MGTNGCPEEKQNTRGATERGRTNDSTADKPERTRDLTTCRASRVGERTADSSPSGAAVSIEPVRSARRTHRKIPREHFTVCRQALHVSTSAEQPLSTCDKNHTSVGVLWNFFVLNIETLFYFCSSAYFVKLFI